MVISKKLYLLLFLSFLPFLAFGQQIQWGTFIDASGRTSGQNARGYQIKVGPDGFVYSIGYGRYLTFQGNPTADTVITHGPGSGNSNNNDTYVLKMSPDGNQIVWACVIGGTNGDLPGWFEFDSSGNILVAGNTSSSNFPVTTDADQPIWGGGEDLFFTKLTQNGELVYSSYLGGSENEYMSYGFISGDGTIFFNGWSGTVVWPSINQPTFPTKPGAYQATGDFATFGDDYFLGRLNADMSFNQGTYLFPRDPNSYREGYLLEETPSGDLFIQGSASNAYISDIPTTSGALIQSTDANASGSYYMVMSRDLSKVKYCTADLSGNRLSYQFQKSNGNIVIRSDVLPANTSYFPLSTNSAYGFKTDGSPTSVFAELTGDLSTIINTMVINDDIATGLRINGEDGNGNYHASASNPTSDAMLVTSPGGSYYWGSIAKINSDFTELLYASRTLGGNRYYDEQNCTWYISPSVGCGTIFGTFYTSDTAYNTAGDTLNGYWLGDRTTINLCSGQRGEPYITAINFPSITSGNVITAPASSYCINSIPEVLDGDEPVVPLPSLKIGYNDFEQNFVLHYQWQVSTAGPSGPFSDINLATEEDYVPEAEASAGSRWYRRIAIAGNIEAFPNCVQPDTSNVVEVVTLSNISHSTDMPEEAYGLCPGSPINVSTTLSASPDGTFGPYTWTLSDISVDTVVLSGSTGVGSFAANGVPAAGLYQLEVTDTRGCVSADTLTVESMVIDAGPATVFTCDSSSLVIGPSGPAPQWENYATNSYSWLPTSNLNNAALLKPTVSPVPASGDSITYSIYVNGCLSDSVKVKNETLTPLPALPADTICQGDSLNMGAGITPQPDVTYQWLPGVNIVDDTDPNSKLIGSDAPAGVNTTTYYLTAMAGNTGCVQTATQDITVYKQPNIPFDSDDPYSCFIDYYGQGPALTLGTGSESGISYSWDVQVTNISATTGLPSTVDALAYLSSTTASSVVFSLTGPEIPLGGMADGDYDLRYIRTSFNTAEPSCMRMDTAVIHYSPPCDGIPGFYCTALTPPNTCGTEGTLIGAEAVSGGLYYEWTPVAGLTDPYTGLPLVAGGPHPGQVYANPDTTTEYHLAINYPNRSGDTLCTIDILVFPAIFNTPAINIPPVAGGCAGTPIQIGSAPLSGLVYSWEPTAGLSDPNIANPAATITENTTYVVTAVDTATGCLAMDTVAVQIVPILVNAGLDGSFCDAAGYSGSIGALAANAAYSYQWTASSGAVVFGNATDAQTTVTIPASTGTVSIYLAVTDLNTSCSQSDTAIFTATGGPVGYAPATTVRVCDGDSVIIGAPAPTGTNYTYAWTSASTGNGLLPSESTKPEPSITPAGAGPWTYDVTVTETGPTSLTCTSNYTVTVSRPTEPVVTVSPAAVPCASAGVTIGVTNSPTAIWTFSWSPTDHIVGFAHNDMRRIRVYPPDTTTYTLTATYQTGCVRTFDIIVPGADYVAEISDDELELCEGDVNPTFSLNSIPAGATVAWTSSPAGATAYLNSTTANNPIFNITTAPAGTYTYTATVNYGTGCVSSASLTVRLGKAIPDIAGADQSICLGECVTIGTAAVSGLSYAWTTAPYDPSAVISFPGDASPEVCPTQNTTYKLTYIDVTSGCTFEDYVSVQINGVVPTLSVISAYKDCQNTSGTATVDLNSLITTNTGTSTSFWLDATASVLPIATPTMVEAGTYYIKSADASGLCTVVEPTTITFNPIPQVSGQAVANCVAQTGYLALTGFAAGDRFDYTLGMSYTGGASYATASVIPFSGVVATGLPLPAISGSSFYTVRVFNADSCSQDITLELISPCCPDIDSLAYSALSICTGSNINFADYFQNPDPDITLTFHASKADAEAGMPTISGVQMPAVAGTYWVRSQLTGETCNRVDSFTVMLTPAPAPTEICPGQTFTISAPTNFTNVQWFRDGVEVPAVGSFSDTFAVTQPGVYTFTGLDASLCVVNICCPITFESCCPDLNSLALSANAVCEGTTFDATINHQADPGTLALYYSTDGSLTPAQLYDFPNHGANNIDPLSTAINPIALATTTTVSSLNISTAGSYTIYVILANGNTQIVDPDCFPMATATITINSPAEANAGLDDSVCGNNSYQLNGSIAGSASSSTWSTSGDGSFDNVNSLTAVYTPGTTDLTNGTVMLILSTDDPPGACLAETDTMILTVYDQPTVVVTASDSVICVGEMVKLSRVTFGGDFGSPPFICVWDHGPTTCFPTVSPTVTTDYAITVTDNNGCMAKDTITITVLNSSVEITSIMVGNCVENEATVAVEVDWTNAPGGKDIEVSIGRDLKIIPAPAVGNTGSQTVTFMMPADSSQNNNAYVRFKDIGCEDYYTYDLPGPCEPCPPLAPSYSLWCDSLSVMKGEIGDGTGFSYTINQGSVACGSIVMALTGAGGPNEGNGGSGAECLSWGTTCHTPGTYVMNITFDEPISGFIPVVFADGFITEWTASVNGQPFNISDWKAHGNTTLGSGGTRYRNVFKATDNFASWLTHTDSTLEVTTATLTFYTEFPAGFSQTYCPLELFLYGSSVVPCCPTIDSLIADRTICSGDPVDSLAVSTIENPDSIAFVYFAGPQSDTAVIYSGGVGIDTIEVANNPDTIALTNVSIPAFVNTGSQPDTFYVYAIQFPTPADAACRPYDEMLVIVNPEPTFTLSKVDEQTCLGNDGSLTLAGLVNGAVYTLTYTYNGGTPTVLTGQTANSSGEITLSNLTRGDYTDISVTNMNGCTNAPSMSGAYDVTIAPAPCYRIGNLIWEDLDNDGNAEVGEVGINGVSVQLFMDDDAAPGVSAGDTQLDTEITVAGGYYVFDSLSAGDYYVIIGDGQASLNGFISSNNGEENNPNSDGDNNDNGVNEVTTPLAGVASGIISLGPGTAEPTNEQIRSDNSGDADLGTALSPDNQSNYTLDFGYFVPVSVGDTAFVDANSNGLQDMGEAPVPGVTVTLYDNAGNQVTTDAEGNAITGTTTTDADGAYLFDNLPPGSYYVVFDVSTATDGNAALYIATTQNANGGTLDPNDSDIDALGVSDTTNFLTSGDSDLTLDAGYFVPISVGDTAFVDANGNGLQDAGDVGIPGITVTLYDNTGNQVTTDAQGNPITGTTTTDADGAYLFTNLPSGSYYVIFDVSTATDGNAADYVATTQNVNGGTLDPNDSDIDALGVSDTTNVLTTGQSDLTLDAGYFVPVSVGDTTFVDANSNGLQDLGEAPVPGVTVTLYDNAGNQVTTDAEGNAITGTTTTDADGAYLFDNLPPGSYYVVFDVSAATDGNAALYIATTQNVNGGTLDPNDSDIDALGVSDTTNFLNSGDADLTLDAGYFVPVSVGDTVWVDNNGNGLQDAGEPGLGGVTVTLYDAATNTVVTTDANGATITGSTVTAGTGRYRFDNLLPGSYYVAFDVTTATNGNLYTASPQDANGNANDEDDSDADPNPTSATYGQTAPTAFLNSGEADTTLDAGYYQGLSLGDLVWLDSDADGTQDVGELGIDGVVLGLEMYDPTANGGAGGFVPATDAGGATVANATTSAGGLYNFGNLLPGEYRVTVLPSNWQAGGVFGPGGAQEGAVGTAGQGMNDTDNTDDNGDQDFVSNPPGGVVGNPIELAVGLEPINDGDTNPNTNLTMDFGFARNLSLGSRVWFDTNNDELLNGTEVGIDGVLVEVYRHDGMGGYTFIEDTLTRDGGYYLFSDLPVGDYVVVLPANNFAAGAILEGYYSSGTSRLPNGNFNQTNAPDPDVDQTDSDDNGAFAITGPFFGAVISDEITLNVPNPLNEPDAYPITFTDPAADNLGDYTVDFGFYTMRAGNQVWNDVNNNGLFDGGEQPLAGVPVILLAADGVTRIDSVGTNNSGRYMFNGLAEGDYIIKVRPPAGYVSSTGTVGSHTGPYEPAPDAETISINDDDNGNSTFAGPDSGCVFTTLFSLTPGAEHQVQDNLGRTSDRRIDFGLFAPFSIGNYVWNDNGLGTLCNNGQHDTGEAGIDGVAMCIYLDPDGDGDLSNATLIADDTTEAGGFYLFDYLVAGNYVVEVKASNFAPSAVLDSMISVTVTETNPNNDGDQNDNGIDDPDRVINGIFSGVIDLSGNEPQLETPLHPTDGDGTPVDINANMSVDFGFTRPAYIGNWAWEDLNRNGLQDAGEPGVDGIIVDLLPWPPDPTIPPASRPALATDTTASGGYYLFEVAPCTSYYLRFRNLPTGYVLTQDEVGSNDTIDSDVEMVNFLAMYATPRPGEQDTTWDIGIYLPTASLGDYVWEDVNEDGLQDVNEPPVPGVRVVLYNCLGDSLDEDFTNAQGRYLFDSLQPGDYYVVFTDLPVGYEDYVFTGKDLFPDTQDSDADSMTGQTACTTLDPGEVDLMWDAGIYVPKASIGDRVWADLDEDGVQGPGEPGYSNIKVILHDCTGTKLDSTTTDFRGEYEFSGLYPGDYYVSFSDIPFGLTFSPQDVNTTTDSLDSDVDPTGRTICTHLDAGEDDPSWDAGLYLNTASIGDRVWFDDNEDGIQDAGEMGVPGVRVVLYNGATGGVVGLDTTDANGLYYFDDLIPGDYYIGFSNIPSGYVLSPQDVGMNDSIDSDVDSLTSFTAVTTLDPGEDDPTWDMGIHVNRASIGDKVWEDLDEDGRQDTGEPGVMGIKVVLHDCTGARLDSMLSGINGEYVFDNLLPGDYYVSFNDLPSGYLFTAQDSTSASNNTDSDADKQTGATVCTTLDPGEDDDSWDAGIYRPNASLGNRVWDDLDEDGEQDAGEPGVAGIKVILHDCTGLKLDSTVTGPNGIYNFNELQPGDYYVSFPQLPVGYVFSPQDASGDDATDSDANAQGVVACTTLDPGENDDSHDAGIYLPKSSISNLVWNDLDEDGVQDAGEPGVQGVKVILHDCTGAKLDSMLTDANGEYLFANLTPGDYYVSFADLPTGYVFSPQDASGDDATDSDVNAQGVDACTTLDPGEDDDSHDAGIYLPKSSISNLVWNDLDEDGVQDPGEPGVQGIKVILHDCIGTKLDSMLTDVNGEYLFDELNPGDYYVSFADIPTGYVFSPQDASGDDATDSDANAQGVDVCSTLDPGEDDDSHDAGIYLPKSSISNLVWNDLDEDGVQDPGEPGVQGIKVILHDCTGTKLDSMLTDVNGEYLFDNLAPGDYYVSFAGLPTGYVFSPQDASGDDATDSDVNAQGVAACTILDPGENDDSHDAGIYLPKSSISNLVWNDLDEDGIQDVGEPGVQGVKVILHDCTGTKLDSMLTDVNGEYLFDNLTPGDYYVSFADLPTGYVFSPQDASGDDATDSDANAQGVDVCSTLDPGEDDDSHDAGIYLPKSSISNFVWNDLDEDGIQDVGEPGVQGVKVILHDCTGTKLDSMLTDVNGEYLFDELNPGDYYVSFADIPTGYVFSPQDASGDDATDSDVNAQGVDACTTLDPGENDDSHDAGIYLPKTAIGDRVWDDLDEDGIQDAGEPGVQGIKVILHTCAGTKLDSMTTDVNGLYTFDNLAPGDYYVSFADLPAGYSFSPQNQGTDDTADSDVGANGATICTTLDPGENDPTWDAGIFQPTASIGDKVWEDLDEDGVQDPGEPGVQGVVALLYTCAGQLVGQDVTDANGEYGFDGLLSGDYHVVFTNLPTGYTISPIDQGGDDATDSDAAANGQTACVHLDPGEDDTTVDAGIYLPKASIGNVVFEDLNRDGKQTPGEPGVQGVKVIIHDCIGTKLDSTTTDASGIYGFDDLVPGDYYVSFELPTGYSFSPKDQGGDDAKDSDADVNGETVCTTLDPGEDDPTWDAGMYQPFASIGNKVWEDLDEDGIQDAGEPGVQGVTVTLYDCSGVLIRSTTTDATGRYFFGGLPTGDYYVVFSNLPSGYVLSPQDAGADDATDSDANPSGQTICTHLNPGENDLTWDAGIYLPKASISDLVWEDLDEDGVQDSGEPGVQGVKVILHDCTGTKLDSTITDANGNYLFDELTPGDYYVSFSDLPAGYVFSPQDQGGNDALDSDVNANGETPCTTLDPGEDDDSLDAGIYLPKASISDLVWEDLDEDGVQDAGEPGVQGVKVILHDCTGTKLDSTTTDANGNYLFDELTPGDYYVSFSDLPTGYVFSPQDQGGNDALDSDVNANGETPCTTLDPGEDDGSQDAGIYLFKASIGDTVWEDLDEDGIQDAGEPGVQGVTVTLFDGTGRRMGQTTTDANGNYLFDNLMPGDYFIIFSNMPTGYLISPQDQGGNDVLDSDVGVNGQTITTTLDPGENDMTWDMGIYLPKASISDLVWEDLDEDGVQDLGEPGVQGIKVILHDCTGIKLDSTTTDANGNYLFDNLIPGDYYVSFSDLPTGYVFSPQDQGRNDALDSDGNANGETTCTTLGPGEDDDSQDAGIYLPKASIGDTVWEDLDEDGVQDAGEPGVQGVTVTLFDGAGTQVGQTTTDANGNYVFDNLTPGDYYVVLSNLPTGYVLSPQDQGGDDALDSDAGANGQTVTTTLDPGENDLTWDAGIYLPKASISDLVWEDLDEDGVQDAGEPGVQGLKVILHDCTGTKIDSTTTDANGLYSFDNLTPSDYYVSFSDLPAGYVFSPQDQGGNDALDSDVGANGETLCTTLDPGEDDDSQDAGIYLPDASIGDTVWEDLDEDGIQDPGETGVGGVTVTLYNCAGVQIAQTTTDLNGQYSFDNLPAGDYYVIFSGIPTGYVFSAKDQGGDDALDSDADANGETDCISVNPGEDYDDLDAGISLPDVSIGDTVWEDLDEDGVQDAGEQGVQGIKVILHDCTGAKLDSTTTDANGYYSFDNLTPGDYYVSFSDLPVGYVFSPQDQGGDDALDSDVNTNGETLCTTLDPGEDDDSQDAGIYLPKASIGDLVWNDLDEDGVQNAGEPGVQGVTVTLYDGAGTQVAQTTTDANGNYLFDNLTPGDYYVVFSNLPAGYTLSPQDQGGDDALDSDAGANGQTATTTLGPGENDMTWDAGIYLPTGSIGDTVFEDTDGDGVQDVGETGMPGVSVDLYNCTGQWVAQATTDANGNYIFDNLPAGDYYVVFSGQPTGYFFSPQDQGTDDALDSDADSTGQTGCFTLDPGEDKDDVDAGIYCNTLTTCVATPFNPAGWSMYFTTGIYPASQEYIFATNGTLLTYGDGTANLIGTVVNKTNASVQWELDIWFENKRDWGAWSALGRQAKGSHHGPYQTWDYYEMDSTRSIAVGKGTMAGDTLFMRHDPPNYLFAFQVGQGANDKDGDFGASGWFTFYSASGFYMGHGDFNVDLNCQTACVPINPTPPMMTAVAMLEGGFQPTTGLMATQLNSSGILPLSQPYNTAPWNYMGAESVSAIPNDSIVDWVLLETRDALQPAQVLSRQAAFINEDGEIVGLNGTSLLQANVPQGVDSFYIVVNHRNHLSVMSASPVKKMGNVFFQDFSRNIQDLYTDGALQNPPANTATSGRILMMEGDQSTDDQINSIDIGQVMNQTFLTGYRNADVTMNGLVNSLDVGRAMQNYFKRSHVPK